MDGRQVEHTEQGQEEEERLFEDACSRYVKTKEILALEVADEKAHDGKEMNALVEHILNRDNTNYKIKTVLADGAIRSQQEFRLSSKQEYSTRNQVRKNSINPTKNNKKRNLEAGSQTRDLLKWKKKRRYGKRGMAETVFSSIKRTYGEYASATKFENTVKEMILKVSLFDQFRGMV